MRCSSSKHLCKYFSKANYFHPLGLYFVIIRSMKRLCLITFTLLLSLNSWAIEFSNKIAKEQVDALETDIAYLNNIVMENSRSHESLYFLLDLNKQTNSLSAWLTERVKYVVEEDFDGKYEEASANSMITMTNIGAYYTLRAMNENIDFSFAFNSQNHSETIIPYSPRVGIIQIGKNLFSPRFQIDKLNLNSPINKIQRLSVLFHEARHSDGKGEYLGFRHVECPTGHDYEGKMACDEAMNASYNISATLILELLKQCETGCSPSKKQMLKLMALDSKYRVIKEDVYWDPTPMEQDSDK